MPEIEVREVFDAPCERVWDVIFGRRFFAAVHVAEGHRDLTCTEWSAAEWGACGTMARKCAYTLPEEGVLRMLRQGPTRVMVLETAQPQPGGEWAVCSVAINRGGNLAESTRCSADFVLRPFAGGRTEAVCRVNYSFEAGLLVRNIIETAMQSEVREGYQRLYDFAAEVIRPALTPVGVTRRFRDAWGSPDLLSELSEAQAGDRFYTPASTVPGSPESLCTPAASLLPAKLPAGARRRGGCGRAAAVVALLHLCLLLHLAAFAALGGRGPRDPPPPHRPRPTPTPAPGAIFPTRRGY